MKVEIEDIEYAREQIKDRIIKTDLNYTRSCTELIGVPTYLKFENMQYTGSFKIRGALNKVLSLSNKDTISNVIAASAGNHAQGVALSAKQVGLKAKIVMPVMSPIVKVLATQNYGAEVILHGEIFDQSYEYARQLEKEKGYIFIHPYEDEKVIAGQGTIGLEILEQLPDVDSVIVAIGGGGLISGVAIAIKNKKPNCKVYGVVSAGFPAMKLMFNQEEVPPYSPIGTIADGIAVKKPSQIMYNFISKYVDDVVEITDDEVAKAIVFLLERTKTVAEGSGAITLAAAAMAKQNNWNLGKKTCVLIGGGNIDMNMVAKVIEKGLTANGRIVRFKISASDRPGQLQKITNVIAQHGGNILEVFHNRIGKGIKFSETVIQIVIESKGFKHIESMKKSLVELNFKVKID
ncbi:MAG: threonine ammonia-lyase [Bdellovibrionaceae bacterium]|nr:threonine ammonia-lyase [Pseudobdellovibrionaceae bacterium]